MDFFDDGMIKGTVISKNETEAKLVIIKAYKSKLSSNKGINLPHTSLNLPALTERDIELLPFICEHADIIGYSFCASGRRFTGSYRNEDIGVVFKIENSELSKTFPYFV
jgi:pyruvate kinase